MCGDGDTAVDMRDDEIAVLVALAMPFGMYPGSGLLIQHMSLSLSVDPSDSGRSCLVAQLIDIGRIKRIHETAVLPAQLVGQHNTQLCWMVASAHSGSGVSHKSVIDYCDS